VKYELIIENNLKKTALKRVRIKVDPSLVCQTEDLSQCDGYEGYILAETGDVPKVLVMSPDGVSSVMDIPQQFLQMLMSDEESEALRAFKEYICNICELDTATPEAGILLNATTIEQVEAILKQVGLTDEELKVLYRNFIIDSGSTVNEGVFSNLLNKAHQTAVQFKNSTTGRLLGKAGQAVATSAKSPGAWLKGAGNVYSALIGSKGGALFNKAGTAVQGVEKAYKVENINKLSEAFAAKKIKITDFVNWLDGNPNAIKTVGVRPTLQLNVAVRRDINRGSQYYNDIRDLYDVIVRNKLDVNKFIADANNYLNSVGMKAPEGSTVQFNGNTYTSDFRGSWYLPKKDDPTKPGAYAPKDLNPQITTAWLAASKKK